MATTVLGAGVARADAGADAQQALLASAPEALAPTPSATVDGMNVAPRVTIGDAGIVASSVLTSVDIGRDPLDGFSVGTADGPINVNLEDVTPATDPAVVVNDAAALFPAVLPSTDLAVRPRAQGATARLSLRDGSGPRSFAFQLSIGPDQKLVALPDGSVAVVDGAIAPAATAQAVDPSVAPREEAADAFTDPALITDPDLTAPSLDTAAADTISDSGASDDASNDPALPVPEPADPSSTDPTDAPAAPDAAPVATDTLAVTTSGPAASTEAREARDMLDLASAQTQDATVMVLQPESLVGADGTSHAATLAVTDDDTVTLTLASDDVAYPASAALRVSAPTDIAASTAAATRTVRYGLSDGRPEFYTPIDSRLKNGPLNVGYARAVVAYDAAVNPNLTELLAKTVSWVAQVRSQGLTPFITLALPDQKVKPNPDPSKPNPQLPELTAYKSAVKAFMSATGIKGKVKLWGAVNEPDLHRYHHLAWQRSYLAQHPALAAKYWGKAQSLVGSGACAQCTVVAGELDGEDWAHQSDYIAGYGAALKQLRHTGVIKALPKVWSLHAYNDLVNSTADYANPTTQHFADFVKDYNHPRVWLSEQGVLLQTQGTALANDPDAPHPRRTRLYGHPARQRLAALDFLRLAATDPAIDRVFYYSYESDNPYDAAHAFDSAMVDFGGNARPAYCVLAFARHPRTCAPKSPPAVKHPLPNGDVTFSGPMTPGGVLTADPGTWTNGATQFDYQWQRQDLRTDGNAWEDIPGATEQTFTPGDDLVRWAVRVMVKPAGSDPNWVRSTAGVIHVEGAAPAILITRIVPWQIQPDAVISTNGLDTDVSWCASSFNSPDQTGCTLGGATHLTGSSDPTTLSDYGPGFNCSPYTYWVTAVNSKGSATQRVDVDVYCS